MEKRPGSHKSCFPLKKKWLKPRCVPICLVNTSILVMSIGVNQFSFKAQKADDFIHVRKKKKKKNVKSELYHIKNSKTTGQTV